MFYQQKKILTLFWLFKKFGVLNQIVMLFLKQRYLNLKALFLRRFVNVLMDLMMKVKQQNAFSNTLISLVTVLLIKRNLNKHLKHSDANFHKMNNQQSLIITQMKMEIWIMMLSLIKCYREAQETFLILTQFSDWIVKYPTKS